jgi:hypothetical protein
MKNQTQQGVKVIWQFQDLTLKDAETLVDSFKESKRSPNRIYFL